MKLSAHFDLIEFTRSQIAARIDEPLNPPRMVIDNLTQLCETILEPLRAQFGRPLLISSGWRPEWLNDMAFGAKNSAHIYGRAADFHVPGISDYAVALTVARSGLPFDQCISEFYQWTHVAIATEPRRQILTAYRFRSRTVYQDGILKQSELA